MSTPCHEDAWGRASITACIADLRTHFQLHTPATLLAGKKLKF